MFDSRVKARFIIVPTVSLHPDEMYLYGRKEWITEPSFRKKSSLINLLDNSKKVEISDKSKRKIKRAVKYLLYSANYKVAYSRKYKSKFKFKVNFITLTLSSPQIHNDHIIKSQLLNQFLIEAKKKWKMDNYIWRAELQQNGNIHFHILSDVWIPWLELRNCWNRIQEKLGYITEFEKKFNHRNPNSTDVHSLKKINNVPAYIVKYMSKNDGTNKVEGESWRCSQALSNLKGAVLEIDDELYKEIDEIKKTKGTRVIDKEHFSGIFFNNSSLTYKKYPRLTEALDKYIKSVFRSKIILIFNEGS